MPETIELTGRELDAAVHVEVFDRDISPPGYRQDMRSVPPYSSDWNAAAEVLEKARTWEPWQFAVFTEEVEESICARHEKPAVRLSGMGLLRLLEPVDICRAALLAVRQAPGERGD